MAERACEGARSILLEDLRKKSRLMHWAAYARTRWSSRRPCMSAVSFSRTARGTEKTWCLANQPRIDVEVEYVSTGGMVGGGLQSLCVWPLAKKLEVPASNRTPLKRLRENRQRNCSSWLGSQGASYSFIQDWCSWGSAMSTSLDAPSSPRPIGCVTHS